MSFNSFVRLAEISNVDSEHLHPPLVVLGPEKNGIPDLKLGYGPDARQEGIVLRAAAPFFMPWKDQDAILVSAPHARSILRPISEGALSVVMLLIFLGALTDMTSAARSQLLPAAIFSCVIVLVGFQAVRQGSSNFLTVYVLLTILLLYLGFAGLLRGVLSHAALHVFAIILGLYNARNLRGKRFIV